MNLNSKDPLCPRCGSHQVYSWYSMGDTQLVCTLCNLRGKPSRGPLAGTWGDWEQYQIDIKKGLEELKKYRVSE